MTCVHHWLVENGTQDVRGVCKHCKAVRMFKGGWLDPRDWPAMSGRTAKPRNRGQDYRKQAEEAA